MEIVFKEIPLIELMKPLLASALEIHDNRELLRRNLLIRAVFWKLKALMHGSECLRRGLKHILFALLTVFLKELIYKNLKCYNSKKFEQK